MSAVSASLDAGDSDLLVSKILNQRDDLCALSEQDLRWMSAGPLRSFLTSQSCSSSDDHVNQAQQIWRRLLLTMKSSDANDRHITAACNTISVFLESACTSTDPHIVEFGLSSETWDACTELVSSVFETGRVKATRQVLAKLTDLLQTLPDRHQTAILKTAMVAKALDVIYTSKPRLQLKASMNVLELLLKKALSLEEFIENLETCEARNKQQWSRRLVRDGMPIDGVLDLTKHDDQSPTSRRDTTRILLFVFTLWHDLIFTDLHPSVISLFLGLSRRVRDTAYRMSLFAVSRDRVPPWANLVLHLIQILPGALDMLALRLFPRLVQLDTPGYRQFVSLSADDLEAGDGFGATNLSTQLAAMQVGRQYGVRDLTGGVIGSNLQVTQLLSHADGNVRFRTFAFLVNSSATTEPIEAEALDAVSKNLSFLYGDADASNRGDISSVTRRMIARIKASSRRGKSGGLHLLETYQTFISSFVQFLEGEFGPTCSYQRHISALKALEILVDSGLDPTLNPTRADNEQFKFEFSVSLHSFAILSSLLNLTMNAFQDVRTLSASLLSAYSAHLKSPVGPQLGLDMTTFHSKGTGSDIASDNVVDSAAVSSTIRRAAALALRSHRADHADGLGRLYSIQYAMTKDRSERRNVMGDLVSRIEQSLMEASMDGDLKAPLPGISLHGILTGLRYCLEQDNSMTKFFEGASEALIIDRMLAICEVLWIKVKNRLCVDAPESEDDDLDQGAGDVGGPKDLLSYSWRALRDSSMLLSSILTIVLSTTAIGTKTKFEKIGILCIEQLHNLRHRGAFSTVARTFATCCLVCSKSSVDGVPELLNGWYKTALQAIEDQAHRLTRRSAGLPALLAAILAPSPPAIFNSFMTTFLARGSRFDSRSPRLGEKESQIPLPQVHILNCLREVFINAKFRDRTEEWVIPALNAATICLSSEIWAIRNCGLMLFRACSQRLCRPRDHALKQFQRLEVMQSSSFIPIARWPESLTVAIGLLHEAQPVKGAPTKTDMINEVENTQVNQRDIQDQRTHKGPEKIFAGLDLLGRMKHTTRSWSEAFPHVLTQMGNRVWIIRDQAARIYAANVDLYDGFTASRELLQGLDECAENERHGRLLTISYIFKSIRILPPSECSQESNETLATMGRILYNVVLNDSGSPAVRSKATELLVDVLCICDDSDSTLEPSSAKEDIVLTPTRASDGLARETLIMQKVQTTLRQSIGTYKCLLTASTTEERTFPATHSASLSRIYEELLDVDQNAALTTLRKICSNRQLFRGRLDSLVELLVNTIKQTKGEAIRIVAMDGITAIMDEEENELQAKSKEDLCSLRTMLLSTGNRRSWNSKLHLRCAMLKFSGTGALEGENCPSSCEICSCLKACRVALNDETEYLTRVTALRSLHCVVQILFDVGHRENSNAEHILRSILILLDALNDDDEDIRDLAISIEPTLIIPSHERAVQPLTSFAASSRLLGHLTESIGTTKLFQLAALKAITTGAKTAEDLTVTDLVECLDCNFKQATKTNVDLFEEEKQNLYADDVRNIKIWTDAIKVLQADTIHQEVLRSVTLWALGGLDRASQLLEDQGEDGALGLSWKSEVLVLFTSIIACSELASLWASDVEKSAIREKLARLEGTAIRTGAHGPMLGHVKSCVENISK